VHLEMHSDIVNKRDWRCTCGHRNHRSLVIQLEAVIERVWRYALRGHDSANMQPIFDRVWRYTWLPGLSDTEDALVQAVVELVWIYTCRM
jgi:hypothetical protein